MFTQSKQPFISSFDCDMCLDYVMFFYWICKIRFTASCALGWRVGYKILRFLLLLTKFSFREEEWDLGNKSTNSVSLEILLIFSWYVSLKGWITYRFSYSLRHNDAKKMTPSPHDICVISRFSTKSIVFQKIF